MADTCTPKARPLRAPHPLGPVVVRVVPRRPTRLRLGAAIVLLAVGAVLGVAAALEPDPRGLGTHEQLGPMQPCQLVVMADIPCPSCGMTTAFAHTVRGALWRAAVVQPMGLLLALATVAAGLLAVEAMVSGRTWTLNWYRVAPQRAVLWLAVTFLAAWAYKIIIHRAG